MLRKTHALGQTIQGKKLEAIELRPFDGAPLVFFLGAVHGDEVEGFWVLEEALREWDRKFPAKKVGVLVWNPVNADGLKANTRGNGRGVDLNRNLPTKDWSPLTKEPRYAPGSHPASEPENQALVTLINDLKPIAILSAHSFKNYQINCNGPSKEWGERLSKICGYEITEDIGYPTPGALGRYAGFERKIPTITLEIERGLPKEKVLALHLPVIHEALQFWEEKN